MEEKECVAKTVLKILNWSNEIFFTAGLLRALNYVNITNLQEHYPNLRLSIFARTNELKVKKKFFFLFLTCKMLPQW